MNAEQTVFPRQCVRIKRDGHRCGKRPVAGLTVCNKHGAAAPHMREKGRRNVARETALQRATKEIAEQGLPDRTPLEHLEAVLEADARAFAVWDAACGQLVAEDGEESTLLGRDKHDALSIHPYVQERNAAASRWARSSKYALDAGVSQRRVEIERERAELMAGALRATLASLGLSEDLIRQGLAELGANLRRLSPAPPTIDG